MGIHTRRRLNRNEESSGDALMNFAELKAVTIPEGNVKSISVGGQVIWNASSADKYTWDAVLASIDAGTYATDYAIGDTVPLDLGSEGLINMQIIAFDADDLADGSGKAPITWLSKEILNTDKRMNPECVELYDYKEQAATTATNNNSDVNANYDMRVSFITYIKAGEVAEITNTINPTEDGTLTITYRGLDASYGSLEVLVNGETIVADYVSNTYATYTVELVSGNAVTVVAKFTSAKIYFESAFVAFKSTGAFKLTTTSNQVATRYTSGYQDATGSAGGWEKTEMRVYLKETIKPLIPEVVRNYIKEVTKMHDAYNTAGTKFTQTSIEDVWLPDINEIFGSSSPYNLMFPDNNSRKKSKVGATSSSYWWLRSARGFVGDFRCVDIDGNHCPKYAHSFSGVTVGFCT